MAAGILQVFICTKRDFAQKETDGNRLFSL